MVFIYRIIFIICKKTNRRTKNVLWLFLMSAVQLGTPITRAQANFDTSTQSFESTITFIQEFFAPSSNTQGNNDDETVTHTMQWSYSWSQSWATSSSEPLSDAHDTDCPRSFLDLHESMYDREIAFLGQHCIVSGFDGRFMPLRHVRMGDLLKTLVLSYQYSLQQRLDKDWQAQYDDVMDYGIAAVSLGFIEVDMLLHNDRHEKLVTQTQARELFDAVVREHAAVTDTYRYPLAESDNYLTKELMVFHIVHLVGLGEQALQGDADLQEQTPSTDETQASQTTPLTAMSDQPTHTSAPLPTVSQPSLWDVIRSLLW